MFVAGGRQKATVSEQRLASESHLIMVSSHVLQQDPMVQMRLRMSAEDVSQMWLG